MNRQARITLKVECIRIYFYVYLMWKYKDEYESILTLFSMLLIFDVTVFQERALQDDLRDTAMVHLCTSAKWAVKAELSSMVLVAAQQVWNAGVRAMHSKLTRK